MSVTPTHYYGCSTNELHDNITLSDCEITVDMVAHTTDNQVSCQTKITNKVISIIPKLVRYITVVAHSWEGIKIFYFSIPNRKEKLRAQLSRSLSYKLHVREPGAGIPWLLREMKA